MPTQVTSGKITGGMTICRTNHDVINIEIQCSESLAHFLQIELTLEQFAMLVTGCHQDKIPMTVRGLDKVGKTRIHEVREVFCDYQDYGISAHDIDALERWIDYHCREEGWTINSNLRSQKSVIHVDGGVKLNYSVRKWIDKEDSK